MSAAFEAMSYGDAERLAYHWAAGDGGWTRTGPDTIRPSDAVQLPEGGLHSLSLPDSPFAAAASDAALNPFKAFQTQLGASASPQVAHAGSAGLGPLAAPAWPGGPSALDPSTAATSDSSGLVINIHYDRSVANAPSGFKAAVNSVVHYFEHCFSDPVTINIRVGYGEIDGQKMDAGAVGESSSNLNFSTYDHIRAALAADSKSGADQVAVDSLPAHSPLPKGSTDMFVTRAEAKALGLVNPQSTALDGAIGIDSSSRFDFHPGDGISPGQYDFFATFAHELSEIMGRTLGVGEKIGSTPGYLPLDLFNYVATNERAFTGKQGGYFSPNGGQDRLYHFNSDSSGDYGDWAQTGDAFSAFASRGTLLPVSITDLLAVDTIGWDLVRPLHLSNEDSNYLYGSAGNDVVTIYNYMESTAYCGDGNDTIKIIGGTFDLNNIDGGNGFDTAVIKGSDFCTLSPTTLVNVEEIRFAAHETFTLTMNDGNVAAGQVMIIDGSKMGAGHTLTFDGSSETDGAFDILGGRENDKLSGGQGDDVFHIAAGGREVAHGGAGNDKFVLGPTFHTNDVIDGGAGHDTLMLSGNYGWLGALSDSTIAGIETIHLAAGHDYRLIMADGNVAAGDTLRVAGGDLSTGDTLVFNGSHETDGRYVLVGGAGDDVLIGGAHGNTIAGGLGADTLKGGAGHDHFKYATATDSTSTGFDTLRAFDAANDHFHFPTTVAAVDTEVTGGPLSTASFDTDLAASIGAAQLGTHDAVLFAPDSGTLAGHTFLLVDANGVAGYQAGQDYVIDLVHPAHLGSLGAANFA